MSGTLLCSTRFGKALLLFGKIAPCDVVQTVALRNEHASYAGNQDSTLEKAMAWLWAGLRSLPFDTDDTAEGMGACAGIHKAGLNADEHRTGRAVLANQILGASVGS